VRTNEAALDIVRRYEGLRLKPYICPAGFWSIGYGFTQGITEDTPPITEEQAEALLLHVVADLEKKLARMLLVPVNDNQFSALVALAYNIGPTNFRHSTLRACVNRRDFKPPADPNAADEFLRWVYGGPPGKKKKLAGLIKRREEERALFLLPVLVK
jgi:lysozyme